MRSVDFPQSLAADATTMRCGSLPALQRALRDQGIVTRQRRMRMGGLRGGVPLTNGPLQHMLRNRVYLGELNHRGQSYSAEHPPLIAPDLFAAVQARLDANRQGRRDRRAAGDALLTGLLFDDRGNRMSPSYAIKTGVRHRYYVSAALVQGRKEEAGSMARVAAEAIEAAVCDAMAAAAPNELRPATRAAIETRVERIMIGSGCLTIERTRSSAGDALPAPITVAWSPPSQRRHRAIIPTAETGQALRPIRSEARSRLLAGIAKARLWLDAIMAGTVPDTAALAEREGIAERTIRQMLSLAFLAPDLVEAAAAGTLPRGFGISRLTELPVSRDEQRRVLGIAQ